MRGKQAPKRKQEPDNKYNSTTIGRLINLVMKDGKKSVAKRVVYDAFDIVQEKTKQEPIDVFTRALGKIAPAVEIRPRRVGGANYQVPFPVKGARQEALALRWLITAARGRKGRPMRDRLAMEILDATKDEGGAIKKKNDVQRMADANKAFAHFAKYG